MEFEHLRTFHAVARSGSFTAASDLLHYAQSTVSVHMRALEGHVGAPLFDRLPGGVRLTEAGRKLMPLSERVLDLAAAAAAVAHQDAPAAGEITVAAPETIVAHHLPSVLRALREHYPDVRVRVEPVPYPEIRSAVSQGTIDIGFLLQPKLRSTSSLAVQPLQEESLHIVAAPGHPLTTPGGDVAERVSEATLFVTEHGCGYRQLLEGHLDRLGVRARDTLEFHSVEAIRRCVEAGLGLALIPRIWIEDSLTDGSLVELEWLAPSFNVTLQMASHPSRWRGPALQAFMDTSVSCIGDPETATAA